MKKLIKVSNNEINFPLSLNYESIYSSLKILLGPKASLFAEISPMTSYTTWYASDDADYSRLSEVSEAAVAEILPYLNTELNYVRNELRKSPQFAPYVDDILRIPDNSYIFYRKEGLGYKFALAGWGCRLAHSSSKKDFVFSRKANTIQPDINEHQDDNFEDWLSDVVNLRPEDVISKNVVQDKPERPEVVIEDISKNLDNADDGLYEEKKTPSEKSGRRSSYPEGHQKIQQVSVRVLDHNGNPVAGESVFVKSSDENGMRYSDDNGIVIVGALNVSDIFSVSFPNQNGSERHFEVEANVSIYDAFIKKLVKYAPVLFVEDQNGNPVKDYDIKIIAAGQEIQINTGDNGVVQLPMMQEGQTFIAVDMANYANTAEFEITQEKAKNPYRFVIRRKNKKVVGISIVNKDGNPMPDITVEIADSKLPSSQLTDASGRAEFPYEMFQSGKNSLLLKADGMNPIKHILKFNPSETEYGIIIKDKKFDWKKLALLGLVPILSLLGWGGYALYEKFSEPDLPLDKMKTGVVLVLEQTNYYVDFEIDDIYYGDHEPLKCYFTYNQNKRSIDHITLDSDLIQYTAATGTGFLISNDGMIATNKHVADPEIPQELAEKALRLYFQKLKDENQMKCEDISDTLNVLGMAKLGKNKYRQLFAELKYRQNQVRIMDKILNTGSFKVKKNTALYVAFTGTNIDPELRSLDGFVGCNHLISGDQGDQVTGNDVAIIQLRNKDKDIPSGAFVYEIPEKDVIDKEMPKNRRVTIIGYNAGFGLQHLELQNGIQPQIQSGEINNLSEKFRIGYDAGTLGGSSGSPVLNDDGMLVAVNNSSVGGSDSFNYGVRIKYLREIYEQVKQ